MFLAGGGGILFEVSKVKGAWEVGDTLETHNGYRTCLNPALRGPVLTARNMGPSLHLWACIKRSRVKWGN